MNDNTSGCKSATSEPTPLGMINIEKLAIGALIRNPNCSADIYRKLYPTDFLDAKCRATYGAALHQGGDGRKLDLPLLACELSNKPEFANENAAEFLKEIRKAVDGESVEDNATHYAEHVKDASNKRKLQSILDHGLSEARNGVASDDVLRHLLGDLEDYRRDAAVDKPQFVAITAADFAMAKYKHDYLIADVLVKGQPCIIGGPKKGLKTSIAVDLAASLVLGGSFLGKFDTYGPHKVLLCSGESGLATLQETTRRVANSIGKPVSELEGLTVCETLPRITDSQSLAEFGRFIADCEAEVVILDPFYRMFSGEGADNIFKMGTALADVCELCLEQGATPIICHHVRKQGGHQQYEFKPAELDDLSWAGSAEYFRQWMLLSRREQYQPGTGLHRLWLTIGGSAGHNSLWAIDVDESRPTPNSDRDWKVNVQQADDAINEAKLRKAEAKAAGKSAKDAQQFEQDKQLVLDHLKEHVDGCSTSDISTETGIRKNEGRLKKVIQSLIVAGLVEQCKYPGGNNREYDGYRLVRRSNGQAEQQRTVDWDVSHAA